MKNSLKGLSDFRVFLNYPFDKEFEPLERAMHFAVIAAGLIPVCAKGENSPDTLRLEVLVDLISSCRFSVHDLSRYKGEGEQNFARFNMPIEMGMALFYSIFTNRDEHRCAFFVETPHDYQRFASDLAGLDPKHHANDDLTLVTGVYEWLKQVGEPYVEGRPTVEMREKYCEYRQALEKVNGSGNDGRPTYHEMRELMYSLCSNWGWWNWRGSPFKYLFPKSPLAFLS